MSASAFARIIEEHRPTLFIDEFDAIVAGNKDMAEQLRGQLNSSFDRSGAHILKSVPLPGGGWVARLFSTWAPTCIAGIGDVPNTVADRAVVIQLTRKLRSESVRRFRRGVNGELERHQADIRRT